MWVAFSSPAEWLVDGIAEGCKCRRNDDVHHSQFFFYFFGFVISKDYVLNVFKCVNQLPMVIPEVKFEEGRKIKNV